MPVYDCNSSADEYGHELLQHGTRGFPVACYANDLVRNPVPWHWHDELELAVVTSGSARVFVGAERIEVKKGEGFFINSGCYHTVRIAADSEYCRMHSVVFHPNIVAGSVNSSLYSKYVSPLLCDRSKQIIHLVPGNDIYGEIIDETRRVWDDCSAEEFGYEFQVRAKLSQIALLLTNRHRARQTGVLQDAVIDDNRLRMMAEYVHENCATAV